MMCCTVYFQVSETTWRGTKEKEQKEKGWSSWEETRTIAADREKWRITVKAACAIRNEEDS